ncbi:NADP-dependent oxidoreductase [Alicyclobacillus macrosporangiidus]|uniref:NADPH:quinone reductase n=1 Tax=Alicyclobacillus macrosporangiidus TaxID=392015 RepID=A0A1I7HDX4_9BACL|nr:NADP-dependent oxidoreductase [Alicyclobacillus macrosporangiidus]SFU58934.1 NADPH:quinone reductase [Alicyclobacillus macrosporangiidus]
MKAVYIEAYGGRDQLRYGELPEPQVGPRDVLIEVHAAAVNPVDWKIRNGWLQQRLQYAFPLILGWDVAGVVVRTGPEVTRFRVGDEVFSRPDIARNGAYAEHIAVDERLVAKKPSNLSFEEAAAVPLAALTAWEALVDRAGVQAGQRVLIHAGAGGVGVYAIQFAKHFGAEVTTTVSARNAPLAQELGADRVIDYTAEDFTKDGRVYDIVFDTVGADVQEKSLDVVKPGGLLISIVSPPQQEACEARGIRGAWFFLEPDGEKLAKIGRLIEEGRVKPVVGAVFPLAEAAKAHELSEHRHLQGKIVLRVK